MQQNERMENGADVESAQSEVCWARIQFNVTRKEEKGEKRAAETECALASEEQKDCRLGGYAVGVLLASREVHMLQYDTRCYFNVRSKADMSQLNLPHGTDN